MRSIGIDIGAYSIKVAELDYTSKDVKLNTYHEFLLPVDSSTDNYVNIIEQLKKIIESYDKNQDRFVIALNQDQVCYRNLVFPFKEKYKISRTISFELEDDLPFDVEDAIIHPKIAYTVDKDSYVLAFAALKENIANCLSVFQDLGIEPDVLSCEGAAISNYFENWKVPSPNYSTDYSKANHATAYLHIGHTRSVLAVEQGGHLLSLRSIIFGGENIAKALMQKYNVTLAESIKNLKEKGFILTNQQGANQDQITFSNIISSQIDNLASEVKRHMISIEADEEIDITEVIISGGTSGIKNLNMYLTQALQVSVNPYYKDFQYMPMLESIPEKMRAGAIVALGLAIEGVKSIKNLPVNFRKEEFEKQSQNLKIFFDKWATTLRAMTALFAIFFIYTFVNSMITERISIASNLKLKRLASSFGLKGREATTSGIQRYVRNKKKESHAKVMAAKLQDINSPLDILLNTTKNIPNKNQVRLDTYHYSVNGQEMTLQGFVNSPRETNLIKDALKNIAKNNKVKIGNSTLRKAGKVSFSYSVDVDRNIGEL